jgi:hypothetical protein
MRNTADVTGDKPIAVLLQSISGVSAINALVAFYDIHLTEENKRRYSFVLSRTPHETDDDEIGKIHGGTFLSLALTDDLIHCPN